MPAKNVLKQYVDNGYYHLYNRGVEKRIIFSDKEDEAVFLSYLKNYLIPKNTLELSSLLSNSNSLAVEKAEAVRLLRLNNFSAEIDLLAFCLMPNHFHLLVKQNSSRSIEMFMRSLGTRYVQYFNHKHGKRVGGLFQDTYKAASIESEEQLLHLTRYIHLNPYIKAVSLKDSPHPSSYKNYLGIIKQNWVKPQKILELFSKTGVNSYEHFVEGHEWDADSLSFISEDILEKDTP
ncbi:MAG: Transposase [Candidatus Amesbacteria bacterium GW2011_GWA1_47_16]|uniref:Transposase IS200-like domain-containing protein n=4 Tax=Candidatus Amesiibacteriota TaxID=1752730 RepID=A0A1F4ZTQ3_9BACT|nr:MAG: Transposase [Candidatus Amesbacteria bacterium GW2011_GWA1_47_16]KKU97764.1 MAG: Transposase [Candidatus Amesbacteria bacterium GW2011_GWB1_48_13]OGD01209.1 MAG: hypothetical protein A2972_01365 [Candidatus Amesbacteria bacterium RIFCSPLOWO2_01_FULL_47_33]OGD09751.1 MAG: hypothetical protein A2395_04250 [Candidatus Amesbacteria bacterium RIFOXYB1_FULL_47_9]